MKELFLISAAASAVSDVFYRLGRAWSKDGTVVCRDEFSADEWGILKAEKMLHIGPAPDEAEAAAAADETAVERIKAVLGDLQPDDFQKDGKPKLDVLKAKLPELAVTAALRDQAWAAVKPAQPE